VIVALDSSVLFAIFRNERNGARWLDFLLQLRAENQLAACDVVWSEVAPLFADRAALSAGMSALGVFFSPVDEAAAFTAGKLFAEYRKRGGPRGRMVPDVMIAAHALHHASGLATADDDFMRAHFPRLKLLHP
jgi:predicted nucleic acid-binding protein